jgi:acyl-CoA ligase (AMP-forming) (exosortase A-associated)
MDFLTHHMVRTTASRSPTTEALVHANRRLSYEEVVKQISGLAFGLRQCGLQRGDRVGVYLDPSVSQALSIFAASQAGAAFVPINGLLFPHQVSHIAKDCRMKAIITTRVRLQSLAPVLKEISSLEFAVIVADEVSTAPNYSEGEALSGADYSERAKRRDSELREYQFEEMCRLLPGGELNEIGIQNDLAAILYTSGSTGKPKGVMLSHANIMAGSSIVSTYLDINECDRILAILPFSFDAGLNQLMTAFQKGSALVLTTFVFAREIVQTLLKEKITGLAGVPTLWSLLAQPNSTLQKQPLLDLRYITNTGGAMPQSVLAVLRKSLPTTKIFLMYGLTEAFRSTYLPPAELDRRPTSMGKAIPNTEILVVNEHGQPSKPGEVGELVHRGPTVSMGYWGQPELTAGVLRPHPFLPAGLGSQEKVCYSGDLVKMDEDGFLYFIGRRDTMIKSSGYRISPTEVEEVLFQSGTVRQAAVIGIPDDVLGQSIKAFVVCRNGDGIDTPALLSFCAQKMPRHMVPKAVEVLDELPKMSNGKVDYQALRCREGL